MKIAIVGKGNVGSHLFTSLQEKCDCCLIDSHSPEETPANADIIIICVKDDAIEEVASRLPDTNAVIAHTSGSVDMDTLKGKGENYGVFYPLQTFTKGVSLNYREIPVFIEGNSETSIEKLKELATLFSDDVRKADSDTRRKLHLASVFAGNFTNALACVAVRLLEETDIDFSALKPLMRQTVAKLDSLTPLDAQTGPAQRGDLKVIQSHLNMLEKYPELQEIYRNFSHIITLNKGK